MEFATHFGMRLPTEAEWEYAARAGVTSRYDGFCETAYKACADGVIDPVVGAGIRRTLRGGGFGNAPRGSGLPYRFGMASHDRHDANGFRVAASAGRGQLMP